MVEQPVPKCWCLPSLPPSAIRAESRSLSRDSSVRLGVLRDHLCGPLALCALVHFGVIDNGPRCDVIRRPGPHRTSVSPRPSLDLSPPPPTRPSLRRPADSGESTWEQPPAESGWLAHHDTKYGRTYWVKEGDESGDTASWDAVRFAPVGLLLRPPAPSSAGTWGRAWAVLLGTARGPASRPQAPIARLGGPR